MIFYSAPTGREVDDRSNRNTAETTGKCNIRRFDAVELAALPGVVAPGFMAAKLIYRLMGYNTGQDKNK
ncbi:MAG: hypothetical protein R6W75_01010 [Smithellaceae bacterium]